MRINSLSDNETVSAFAQLVNDLKPICKLPTFYFNISTDIQSSVVYLPGASLEQVFTELNNTQFSTDSRFIKSITLRDHANQHYFEISILRDEIPHFSKLNIVINKEISGITHFSAESALRSFCDRFLIGTVIEEPSSEVLRTQIGLLADHYTKKQIELDSYLESIKKKIENEHSAKVVILDKEYEEKVAQISNREKELDLKSNEQARRDIFFKSKESLSKELASMSVSTHTQVLLAAITFIFFLVLAIGVYGIKFYSGKIDSIQQVLPYDTKGVTSTKEPTVSAEMIDREIILTQKEKTEEIRIYQVKTAFISLFLVGCFIAYARWIMSWFEKQTADERYLKKFRYDLDRSYWISELYLELSQSLNERPPLKLFEMFSKGLFQKEITKSSEKYFAHDSAIELLMGKLSKMKIKTPGAEVDVEK